MKYIFYTIVILIGVITFNCTEFDSEQQASTTLEEFPDQESWNATMIFTKEGRKRAILNSGYIAKYNKKKITLMKQGIKIDFYDQEGFHKSVLTANEGKVYDDREDLVAQGNVIVKSDNGNVLYSEELKWDNKQQKIISDVPVMMVTVEGDTSYGNTLVTDPELKDYELTNARGSFRSNISIDE